MSIEDSLRSVLLKINGISDNTPSLLKRIRSEIDFANKLSDLHPDKKDEWLDLILKAAEVVADSTPENLSDRVREAETILEPIGEVAKEYTIHCCGNAHIDMNWLWPWQETVSVTHDTFLTVDRLMDEFPDFHYSQSQASTYAAMEEYCPEVFEKIKKRIAEGRWESTASMWVEGDKNLASGESICRNILYTRRYMKERFGLPYDAVKIDWEGDTFGHPHTLPAILVRGGVKRYYRHRTRPEHWLVWWKAPDGSRVLAFYDKATYIGRIDTKITDWLLDYVRDTGLKTFMYFYGVGDHGGGPTRRDLMQAVEFRSWPIFPNILLSTTDAYFSAIEKLDTDLPVVDDELNYVFEGCYTSQSNIKLANRVSENILYEAEVISLAAGAAVGFPYPMDDIRRAWRMTMFNQFHDILPGSGIHATYEHAQGLFQEIQAIAGSIKTRALRQLASKIDTSAASGIEPPVGTGGASVGEGIGAGQGDLSIPGGISTYCAGTVSADPFVIFNSLPFKRSEMVVAKVWDKDIPLDTLSNALRRPGKRMDDIIWKDKIAVDCVAVKTPEGGTITGQVLDIVDYGGIYKYVSVMFPVKDIPAMGYGVYTVDFSLSSRGDAGAKIVSPVRLLPQESKMLNVPVIMENEYMQLEVDRASGAVKHLIEKSTGYDYVPDGSLLGILEMCQESPNNMTAWEIGQIMSVTPLRGDGSLEILHYGPNRCAVKTSWKVNESRISVEIGLNSGSPMVDFTVIADWLERGTPETGTPMLRAAFPVRITSPKARYEIPFGSKERPVNGQEAPALRWADISGGRIGSSGSCGITLVNSSKYGHNADGYTLRLSLIRSSYCPDPLPEIGHHEIRFAVLPHDGLCSVPDAMRNAASFNLPLGVLNTDIHHGSLPSSKGFVEVLTPNIMLAGLKKAEDSDAVIVRLYELEGRDTEARIKFSEIVRPGALAREVDLMEQPLGSSSARMEGDVLVVRVSSYGITTVAVG